MINYEREQMQSVGFIGLGIMGMPMVKNLLNAGFEVNIWNRTVEKSDQLSNQGANSCQSPGDVARNSEVIIICVTATSDVEAVLLGSESITDPIINGVEKSNIVIDMSTISPARTRDFAIQLNSILILIGNFVIQFKKMSTQCKSPSISTTANITSSGLL